MRKAENLNTVSKMGPVGLNSLIPNSIAPRLPFLKAQSSATFGLKMGALNSPRLTGIPALSGSSATPFPTSSRSPSHSTTLPFPMRLPQNMGVALFPSALEPTPSLMATPNTLFPYPNVLASTMTPEEQQYLRIAQMQAADANAKGLGSSSSGGINFKNPAYASRNYLELAMLVCNTFRGKLFPCPHCRYVTDRRNNLKRHVATMHQACDKQLECCGVTFATKASLREHIAIFHHNGYSCAFCGRRFCRKALLKRHLSVHNGQKDYTCPHCDYATSHKSNLERHKRIHARINVCGSTSHFNCEGDVDDDDDDIGDVDGIDVHDDDNNNGKYFYRPENRLNDEEERLIGGDDGNVIHYQNGRHFSALRRTMDLATPQKVGQMISRDLDRRSHCMSIDTEMRGIKSEMTTSPSRHDKEILENRIDTDVRDSDSDVDIDGMEQSDLEDSYDVAMTCRSIATNVTASADASGQTKMAACQDQDDDIHPLNLVKTKTNNK